eukprot:766988-Hanusia_phi.AAC.2
MVTGDGDKSCHGRTDVHPPPSAVQQLNPRAFVCQLNQLIMHGENDVVENGESGKMQVCDRSLSEEAYFDAVRDLHLCGGREVHDKGDE